MSLRLLRSGACHPCFNMALDEVLLRGTSQTLRIYGWQPAGLSLGYFQAAQEFREVAERHGLVMVRRLTGGGAILHDQEVTFSLSVDDANLGSDVPGSYELVHDAMVTALDSCGVPTERSQASTATHRTGWCFAQPGRTDVLLHNGRKLLGSAQRRIRQPTPRVLHHGSLVLQAHPLNPFCGSVADHADPGAVTETLIAAFADRLAIALAMPLTPDQATDAEVAESERLAAEKYADRAFVWRR